MTAQLSSGARVDVLRVMDLGIESLMDGHTTMWTAHDLMVMRAAVAELIAERDAYAARLAEDRALLDAIRDVAGGPYDTIARRVAELVAAASMLGELYDSMGAPQGPTREKLRAALARMEPQS